MNNILKKNILKKEDTASTSLPHSTRYDVSVKTNQIVHAALNYALQKLVDNDLYIEKKLLYESNYTLGPVKKNEDDVPLYADNIKFFDGIDGAQNNLSVVQKIPYDLTATISSTLSLSVRFLYDSVCYLATTQYGIYKSTDNMKSWQKLTDVKNLPTGNYNTIYLQNNYDNIVFTTPDAVYKIEAFEGTVDPEAGEPSCIQLFGKYQHDNTAAVLSGNTLFVGNQHGLYSSSKKDGQGKYIDFIKENTIAGNVKCIEFLSNDSGEDKMLVGVNGTSPGLYESKKQYAFYNLNHQHSVSGIRYSTVIDNVLYVAGSNGLSCIGTSNQLQSIDGLESCSINKLVKVRSGTSSGIYACTSVGIYKLAGTTAARALSKFTSNVVDICYANEMTVVAETYKVQWTNCKVDEVTASTTWIQNDRFGSQPIRGLVPQEKNLNVYTENRVYTLEIGLTESSHLEDQLSTVFDNISDITTVYFDDDNKVLIGTAAGLVDQNLEHIRYASSLGQEAGDNTITAHVNKVRYLQIFGKDIWCACTRNGAYMLKQGNPGLAVNWILDGQHILQGENVTDIAYDEASKSLAAAVGDILYCLVLPDSIASGNEPYSQTQYLINKNNYTANKLDGTIETLANFAGKIIVLKTVALNNQEGIGETRRVTSIELFQNFSGNFEKTPFLDGKTVVDMSRIQTFVTNGYAVENYARTTEPALYKYVPASEVGQQAEFKQIVPDITQLSVTRNKMEITLAYRHLISPTEETIPKSICMLPSDRFSEIMLASSNSNIVSAYDIYDMKVDKYISTYATYQDPEDIKTSLALDFEDPKDNVKTAVIDVKRPIKGISYVVNTIKDDVIDQQQNMQCLIATDVSVATFNTVFKCAESLKFEGLDSNNSEYDEMQQFSLIPYAVKTNQELDIFERKYVYIGIAGNKLYRYFENEDDDSDFDRGYMKSVTNIMIDSSAELGNEIGFFNYVFSYDKPFDNSITELKNKFQNSPAEAGSQAKFVLFATTAGPLAATVSYGNPETYHDWFVNFTKIPGLPIDEIPVDLCRLDNYIYVATDTHIYRLDINACKLDELGQIAITDYAVLARYNNSLEFNSIRKILTIGNDVYVLGRRQNVEALTKITNTVQTISDGINADTDIAALPGTTKAVIKTGSNNLKIFDSSKTTNYISTLSTEMQYNAVIQNNVITATTDDGIDHYATVNENVVLTGNFPCSADRIFTQYDYIQNKYNVYFATAWHSTYNSYYIPEYSQTRQISADLSGISKYDGMHSEIEFNFNDTIQYDANSNAISDETVAVIEVNRGTTPHTISAIANNTALYLARPADDKDDTVVDKYGITYMFFTKSGEIYSGSYGFDIDEIKKQLHNGGSGYSLADFSIPADSTIQCIDAQTFDKAIALYDVTYIHGKAATTIVEGSTTKSILLDDGSTITVEEGKSGDLVYVNAGLFGADDLEFVWDGHAWRQQQTKNIIASIAALGTTAGLVVKLPGSMSFSAPAIIGNDDLYNAAKEPVKSISISERSITFITNSKIVTMPYSIDINGQFSFLESKAKFSQIQPGNQLNDIFVLQQPNLEREQLARTNANDEHEYFLAMMSTGGVYEPTYCDRVKNEAKLADNVNILYQHNVGMFLVNGNTLSSYENAEDMSDVTTITAANGINFLYENSKSSEIYYGSGNGVFVISRSAYDVSEMPFDETANRLLAGKFIESIFKKDNYYCYEIRKSMANASNRYVVKTIETRVEDTIVLNDANQLFSTLQSIKDVRNYNASQLIVVCSKPMLVDKQSKIAEEYTSNITPAKPVSYYTTIGSTELAIADNNMYSRYNGQQYQQICLDVAVEVFDQIDPSIVVLVSDKWLVDSMYGIFSYDRLDYVRYYDRLTNKAVTTMLKVDDSTMLVGTTNGMYKYYNGSLLQCNALAANQIDSISYADTSYDGFATYYLTSGPRVYKTKDKNFMRADQLFDLSKANSSINAIFKVKKFGNKSYVFGTNVGVINTYDKYKLVDTWSKQSTSGISKSIKESYDSFIQQHIQQQHSISSLVTTVNDTIMPVDLSEMPEDWQKTTNQKCIIENDYVDEVEFNGDVNYVTAEYANFTTYDSALSSNSYKSISGISYIMKKYKSNMKELYIYIPTTGTQYVNHVEGLPYCSNSNYAFIRSNAETAVSGSVADLKTKLRVWLDKEHFDFNEIYNVLINGNSLPLKIFTDAEKHDVGESQQYFHSYMEPSIVNTFPAIATTNDDYLPLQNVKDGKYFFDFSCFGTDAQSIKIVAKTACKYTVVFNANGANVGQMDSVVLKEDEQFELPECAYVKDGYIFKGWALSENGAIAYTNKQKVVNLSENNNGVVELYASWKYYSFDSQTDTVLTLASNKTEFLLAASEQAEDAANVVVDYDYAGDTVLTINGNGQQFQIASGTLIPSETNVVVEFED